MTEKTREFAKDFRYITMSDVKAGYIHKDWKQYEIPEDVRNELFEAFTEFVAKTARGNRRQRIYNAYLGQIKDCGILRRLWYNTKGDKIEYCCGQEWNSEMAILRDVFD